jgi:hypothetical protein
MATVQDVNQKIDRVVEAAGRSFKLESQAHYQEFQSEIEALESLAREAFQSKLNNLYWPILEKLEEGKALTAAEHEILELLMVGEAKYYLQAENEVDHWRGELKRLIEDIKQQQAAGLDEIDSLMQLRALCREALRVLPDLVYFFRERERVRKFEELTRDAIDTETRRSLANLIKEMIESDEV